MDGGVAMRIVLTSILCRSGLMTHVIDLAQFLRTKGVEVGLALMVKNSERLSDYKTWLGRLGDVPIFSYATTEDLALICRRFQPQLMHAHSPSCFHSSVNVSMRYRLPFIVTLHSTLPVEKLYPLTLWMARSIITVGPAQARMIPNFQTKAVMIPNGIDLERFRPKKSLFRQGLKVCWFGRTHGEMTEGVGSLNQALALLRAKGVRIEAYFLGSAPGVPKDQFIDLGWLDDPVSLLQKTQFAFGHGRALREAIACGNIGFLLGAGYGGQVTRELLGNIHHLDAFPEYKLPETNPEHLASDLLEYIGNPERIARKSKEAREIALEYFDRRLMGEATIHLYRRVLWGKAT